MDYKIDDIVLYGTDGVCRISEVTERKIGSDTLKYLILMPVYNEGSTIFVPLANEKLLSKIRAVPAEEELVKILDNIKTVEVEWIDDDSERKEKFHRIMDEGDTYGLICLIKAIYVHQSERLLNGKKLHVIDERMMKDAERVLCDEISYLLGIDRSYASTYIREKINI